MSSDLARNRPSPVAMSLSWTRWGVLLSLLALECVAVGVLFEIGTRGGQAQWWAVYLQTHPSRLRLAVAACAAMLLVGGKRFWDEFAQEPEPASKRSRFWLSVLCHLLIFSAFFTFTGLVLQKEMRTSAWPGAWAAAWAALALTNVVTWSTAVFPRRFWSWLVRRGWVALPAGLAVGMTAVVAGKLTDQLWPPLSQWNLRIIYQAFTLVGWDAFYEPATFRVGTPTFAITVAPGCSGYQGIGLICVFLGVYLWLFRSDLRFPRALLLLPLGVVVIWLTNVLRLIALVALGTWVSPELALGGFHSQAGWIAFLAVGLGLAAAAQRTHFFSAKTSAAEPGQVANPTAAYLAPFLALVLVSMVSDAFSTGFDHLYPLRVLAVAGVLWIFRHSYADLRWTWSWSAAGIGVVAFVLWIALEPATSAASADRVPDKLSLLPPGWAAVWLCFRMAGSVVTVPIAEELVFRGFLTRRLIASEFQDVPLGRFSWLSFLVSSALFGVLHGRWLAGMVAGMLYALALYRRKQLADAVVAHATTNALLATYVLAADAWVFWA